MEKQSNPPILTESTLHQYLEQYGNYDGYLRVLQSEVERLADVPTDADTLAEMIGLKLARGRLVGIARRINPKVVHRAVELGVWTSHYAESLMTLVGIDLSNLDADDSINVTTEGLDNLLKNYLNQKNNYILLQAIPNLSISDLDRVYAVLKDSDAEIPIEFQIALVERDVMASEVILNTILGHIQTQTTGKINAYLANACSLLSEKQILDLYAIASTHDNLGQTIDIIVELMPYLNDMLRSQAGGIAFDHLKSTLVNATFKYQQLGLLANLILHLEGGILHQVVEFLISQEDLRTSSLSQLLPNLAQVINKVDLDSRQRIITYVVNHVLSLPHRESIEHLMSEMTPSERRALFEQALTLPIENSSDYPRQRNHNPVAPKALIYMLPYLNEVDKAQAISTAYEMTLTLEDLGGGFEYIYSPIAEVVTELAPYLEGEQLQQIMQRGLHGALSLPEHHHMGSRPRLYAINKLAPYFLANQIQVLIDRAFQPISLWDEKWLENFADYMSPETRQTVLIRRLEQADKAENDPNSRDFNLAGVITRNARFFSDESLQRALDLALELSSSFSGTYSRSKTLLALAPSLTESLLEYVLSKLSVIRDDPNIQDDVHDDTLVTLAPFFHTQKLLEQIQNASQHVTYEHKRLQALSALVPHYLGDEQSTLINQIIESMNQLDNLPAQDSIHKTQVSIIQPLASYLVESQTTIVVDKVLAETASLTRLMYLLDLIPYLDRIANEVAFDQAIDDLFDVSPYNRSTILVNLLPYLTQQDCDDILNRMLDEDDVQKNTKQFEFLSAYLSESGFSELLDVCLGGIDAFSLYQVLTTTERHFTGDNLQRLVDFLLDKQYDQGFVDKPQTGLRARIGSNEPNDYYRGFILTAIIPYLEPAQLEPIRQTIQQLINPLSRATTIATFIKHHLQNDSSRLGLLEIALEAVTNIPNYQEQMSAIDSFVWDTLTIEIAIKQDGNVEDLFYRSRLLAYIVSLVPDNHMLVEEVQQTLLNSLQSGGSIYEICTDSMLCTPPIFTPVSLQKIVKYVTAVYEEWEWL